MNLIEQLVSGARDYPERLALVENGGQITFADLCVKVSQGAEFLRSCGLRSSDRILILEPISINLYIHLLAIFHAGMTAIIIDPSQEKAVIKNCLDLSRPVGFIGSGKAHLLRLVYPEIRKIKQHIHTTGFVPFSKKWKLNSIGKVSLSPSKVEPDRSALITFTSGSTGKPKAVSRTHGFLLAQHKALAKSLNLKAGEVDLITLPVFAIANLASGLTSVIADTDLRFPAKADSKAITKQCEEHLISRCAGSPAFFQKIFDDQIRIPFETIYTGGAPVFPHLLDAIQRKQADLEIVTVYGSTEAEPISHITWGEVAQADHLAMKAGRGLLVGKPVPELKVMICDSRNSTDIGEIAVTGEHVLKGYLDGKGDAETKFIYEGETWHKTGDSGYLDDLGRLWLMGRESAKFVVNGEAIYPFGVECAVMHHRLVKRCAALEYEGVATLCLELYDGEVADVERDFTDLGYLKFVQLECVPVDARHNAKVDYPRLKAELARHKNTSAK